MNKFKSIQAQNAPVEYRSWKKKEEPKKELNIASFTEFPDLVKDTKKTNAFEGTSLAAKLKQTIAEEEEAAVLKRIKKGETPEMILRESCVSLPLKGANKSSEPFVAPWWLTDASEPIVLPRFKHKTYEELSQERKWKRLGINPNDLMLYDDEEYDDEEDDGVPMPFPTEFDTMSEDETQYDDADQY